MVVVIDKQLIVSYIYHTKDIIGFKVDNWKRIFEFEMTGQFLDTIQALYSQTYNTLIHGLGLHLIEFRYFSFVASFVKRFW